MHLSVQVTPCVSEQGLTHTLLPYQDIKKLTGHLKLSRDEVMHLRGPVLGQNTLLQVHIVFQGLLDGVVKHISIACESDPASTVLA
eukprot:1409080-Amphidinium_carterae.1